MKHNLLNPIAVFVLWMGLCCTSCEKEANLTDAATTDPATPAASDAAVVLVIDEESIDNDNKPNGFRAVDVNDPIKRIGQRNVLRYFQDRVGSTITLYTGEVGDEGWHALRTIPVSWRSAGPGTNGTRNFIQAGPGLGGGNDPEKWLEKVPGVTPLRATGLKMLVGQTVLAVVYDSDISINYSPLYGSLTGANLGIVAFDVLEVVSRTDGSSGSLPAVTIRIRNASTVAAGNLALFSNAPVPQSSSVPFDVRPPATTAAAVLVSAP